MVKIEYNMKKILYKNWRVFFLMDGKYFPKPAKY